MSSLYSFEASDNRLKRSLLGHMRYARHYLPFFIFWVRRGIKVRYSQTSVGILWAVLQPLLSSLVYIIVFSLVVRVSTGAVPYPVFIVTGIVLWTYSSRIITSSASSIISHIDIVTRVRFPREFLPLSVWVESLIDLLFGVVILIVIYTIYRHPIYPTAPIALYIFAVHSMLALGLGFIFAGLTSYVRDLLQVLPILIQLLLYISPVIYPLTFVPETIRSLFLLNPFGPIFAAYQQTLLFGEFTMLPEMLYVTVIALVTLIGGYLFFKRMEWKFADAL